MYTYIHTYIHNTRIIHIPLYCCLLAYFRAAEILQIGIARTDRALGGLVVLRQYIYIYIYIYIYPSIHPCMHACMHA